MDFKESKGIRIGMLILVAIPLALGIFQGLTIVHIIGFLAGGPLTAALIYELFNWEELHPDSK